MKGINPKSKFSLTIKELIAGALGLGSLLAVFFTLQSEIALAKELPKPEVTQVTESYLRRLIRESIARVLSIL